MRVRLAGCGQGEVGGVVGLALLADWNSHKGVNFRRFISCYIPGVQSVNLASTFVCVVWHSVLLWRSYQVLGECYVALSLCLRFPSTIRSFPNSPMCDPFLQARWRSLAVVHYKLAGPTICMSWYTVHKRNTIAPWGLLLARLHSRSSHTTSAAPIASHGMACSCSFGCTLVVAS